MRFHLVPLTVVHTTLVVGFAIGLFATPALAIIQPCSVAGITTYKPAHPQAKNVLTFDVLLYTVRPAGDLVLSKSTLSTGNQIQFDVVFAPPDAVSMFTAYQSFTPLPGESIEGTIGPLPVGVYGVTTSLHQYDPATGLTSRCGDKQGTLTVYSDDGLSPVIEYYSAPLDHYFITQDSAEITALDAGVFKGWVRTGQSFLAYRPKQGAGQPVSRYYGLPSAGLDTHFFTSNFADIFLLIAGPFAAVWELETGDAFDFNEPIKVGDGVGTCMPGEVPVYRLWNQRKDSNHRYTTVPSIKAQMIAKGYVAEGYGPDAVMNCAFTR